MRILVFVLLLLGCSGQAPADISATYRSIDGNSTMVVQVAGNGDSRFEVPGEIWHMLYLDGVSYVVYQFPYGVRVARVDDLQRAAAELGPATPPSLNDMRIVQRGETKVGDYAGTAYYVETPYGLAPRPQIVISRDPALAPLGAAFVRQVDFSIAMIRRTGGTVPPGVSRAREILSTGAPVLYGGHRLERIDRREIGGDQLRLPAPALSLEQIRGGGMGPALDGAPAQ